jgi:hypothetical protein
MTTESLEKALEIRESIKQTEKIIRGLKMGDLRNVLQSISNALGGGCGIVIQPEREEQLHIELTNVLHDYFSNRKANKEAELAAL